MNKSNKTNHIKRIFKGEYSLNATLQDLEAQEEIRLEELLQNVQTLEDTLQDLPSQEDLLAEVERLTEQMKRDLEEYLNES
jgi:cell division protein FtsB